MWGQIQHSFGWLVVLLRTSLFPALQQSPYGCQMVFFPFGPFTRVRVQAASEGQRSWSLGQQTQAWVWFTADLLDMERPLHVTAGQDDNPFIHWPQQLLTPESTSDFFFLVLPTKCGIKTRYCLTEMVWTLEYNDLSLHLVNTGRYISRR